MRREDRVSPDNGDTHGRRLARWKVIAAVICAALFSLPFKVAAAGGQGRGAALGLLLGVCVLFGIPSALRWRRLPPEIRERTWGLGWRLALAAALGNAAQGLAFQELHAGVASVVIQTNVLFVAGLGVLWLKEPLTWRVAGGILLTLGGVFLMRAGDLSAGGSSFVGVVWGLLAALFFSMMDLASRRWSRGADAMVANVQRAALAAVLLALVPGAIAQLASFGWERWGASLAAAFLGPGLARGLLISASRDLPAVESSLLQQLRVPLVLPMTSLAFALWPTPYEWAGCGLVGLGLLLPLLRRARPVERLRATGRRSRPSSRRA